MVRKEGILSDWLISVYFLAAFLAGAFFATAFFAAFFAAGFLATAFLGEARLVTKTQFNVTLLLKAPISSSEFLCDCVTICYMVCHKCVMCHHSCDTMWHKRTCRYLLDSRSLLKVQYITIPSFLRSFNENYRNYIENNK